MRIAWFTHRYHPCIGGAEAYGRAMVRRYVADGHAVDVFTSDAHDLRYYTDPRRRKVDAPALSIVDGARVHRLAVKHLPMQRYVGRVMSYAPHWPTQCRVASYMPIIPGLGKVRGDYDAVFGVGFPFTTFSYAALQTARAAGSPLILTPFLHLSTPGDPVNRTYTRPHQVRLLAEANLVVSPTPLATDAVAGWGIPRDRLMTLPMAIEHEDVTGGDGPKYRSTLGLQAGPVVGQLGALDPNKGTCDLVRAVARLNDARATTIALLLAGSATPEFEAFLDEGGWRQKPWLRLLGPIAPGEVPDFYDALDIFAMPSRTDSFGIVYLEAWANGKPVVAASAGGVPEVVRHGETGLLVRFGDVPALTDSLGRLIEDRNFARRLGEAGRALVRSGYTWDERYRDLASRVERAIAR
ncbi:MAG TPA: glycosyltransferase family 4 protein, partial [Isosphaeraceae bacterium]